MARNIRLYSPVKVPGKSFVNTPVLAQPNQSLTLRQIIQRYVRGQPLPVTSNEGLYETRFGDLEKLSREDITVQMERAAELKTKREAAEKRKEKYDEEKSTPPPPPAPPTDPPGDPKDS
jgi:hypothetical protein